MLLTDIFSWLRKVPANGADELRAQLLAILATEQKNATAKIANSDYWGHVGYIEMQAVRDIRECIEAIPAHVSKGKFERLATKLLDKLATQWRCNPDDEDGYGVATVHAVGRALANYRGR